MIWRTFANLAALCALILLSVQVGAQVPAGVKTSSSSIAKKVADKNPLQRIEPALITEGQRHLAIDMMVSLLKESDTFKDQTLRVQFQARAADVLWDSAPDLSTDWFRRAWDTAEKIDREAETAAEEARSRLTSRRGMTFIPPVPDLRAEVLRLAAKRNQKLGTELLDKLEAAGKQEENDAGETNSPQLRFFDPTEPSSVIAKRLEVATELVKIGEVERAKAFANPALNYATSQGLIFLGTLRQKDAAAADELYSRLLLLTLSDERADATTVSLLSSYVFTPNLLVTATRRGRVSNQWSEAPLAPPPAALRTRFLRIAAEVLLRPLPPPNQDRTSAGRAGMYFTIARLLSFFERYAPDHLPALNARLGMLAPDTPEMYRNNDNGMLTAGLDPETAAKDDVSHLLNLLSSTPYVSERDIIYVKAIRAAASKGDKRVREFADKIDNPNLQKRARVFASFVAVRQALGDKDAEAVVRIIRTGDLPPIQRVWAYAEAGSLLKKADPARAIQLLDEAALLAYSMSNGELERVQALTCVASHFYNIDRARMWDVIAEVVKSSNAGANFTTDESKLTAQVQATGVIAILSVDVPAFNLLNLFELLAKDDFLRASTVVKDLKGEGPRALTNLAIARAVLEK